MFSLFIYGTLITLCGSITKDEVNEDKVQPACVEHLKFNIYMNN